jgi:hypothetical protein
MRAYFASCALSFCLFACGGQARSDGDGEAVEQPRTGWSIRDDVPYPRSGHSAVIDEANDRMIVFGGGAGDVWALPLSGPNAHRWTELHPEGKPPSHAYGGRDSDGGLADSAVYDPIGQRMLVLLTPLDQASAELWELSLSGKPNWKRLPIVWELRSEFARGCLAMDAENRRLFAAGGIYNSGIWSLSLDADARWTRIGENPAQSGNSDIHSCLMFDDARRRLILFGGLLGEIWELSPETATGTVLEGARAMAQRGAGMTAVLDSDSARVVSYGGDASEGEVFVYELASDTLTSAEHPHPHAGTVDASAVLDAKRRRILYFGGNKEYPQELEPATNAVSALDLDTFTWSELVPASRFTDSSMARLTSVWDPMRAAAVAYGHHTGATLVHGLAASDAWTPLPTAEPAPSLSLSAAVYDPEGQAIVSFGGFTLPEPKVDNVRLASSALARLASVQDASWESLDAGAGPLERSEHVAVYDSSRRRMVIHGGIRNLIWSASETLDDVWALALDGSGGWSKLEPSGVSPRVRSKHVGIYDPDGDRLLIYGQVGGTIETELWSLSLGDAPEWTKLEPRGAVPGVPSDEASAVYDSGHRRMIFLNFDKDGLAQVYALELDSVVWRRFCPRGMTLARPRDVGTIGKAVLAPDGLFVTMSGGAFRFDLERPYC